MPKEVNGVTVKLQAYNKSNKQDNVSKTGSRSSNSNVNETYSIAEHPTYKDKNRRQLDRLKRAIGSGNFRINPAKVAEKLIQFEIQLSA